MTISRRLADPQQRGKVVYALDEVLLCLLAVLAGAESVVDIARFGEKKLALLRRFRPFADGTPYGAGWLDPWRSGGYKASQTRTLTAISAVG